MHQNIQGLGNKIEKLQVVLSEINSSIVVLSEHWQSSDQIKLINLENYLLCSSFCRNKNKHGGVSIFVNSNLKSADLPQIKEKSIVNVIECSAIDILSINVVIIALYRPPSGDFYLFIDVLGDILSIVPNNRTVIVVEDFNVNFLVVS